LVERMAGRRKQSRRRRRRGALGGRTMLAVLGAQNATRKIVKN
jgi:hypothetical protein